MIESYEKVPIWKRPSFDEEIGEFKRTAEDINIPLEILKKAFPTGSLSELQDDDWLEVENCDSSDPSWTREEARAHLKDKRDFGRIEEGLVRGAQMPAPIVLYRKNHRPYLIAGSSRLLGCRVLNLRPVVFKIDLKE